MDRKKLIGTIIGVIMFGLLMAGATYAWLSFGANVLNARVTGNMLEYWVDYESDAGLSDMPILTTVTPTTASEVVLTAVKPSNSLADHITLKLKTTSTNALTQSGAVNYVVCEGTYSSSTCTSSCTTNFNNKVANGTVSSTNYTSDIVLVDKDPITSTTSCYHVYFWLDAATVVNAHIGTNYTGYIHAEANQADQSNNL